MSNLDIYHTAKVLVKHHGKDAPALAAIRADEPLSAGDLDGYAVYKRVMNATEELLARVRPPGASVQ